MTIEEFYALLSRFDWTYAMSDDHGVWTRGEESMARKNSILRNHPEWKQLHDDFYHWGWRKPGCKRPELKDYV